MRVARTGEAVARWLACAVMAVASGLLLGCASFEVDSMRVETRSLPPASQGRIVQAVDASRPDTHSSGFRLMPSGGHALATRLALIRAAHSALDLQYFIVQPDATGKEVLRELRDAAARNVRVRVLIDDLYTQGSDELLRTLAAHDNVEVRLFNPFMLRNAGVAARYLAQPFGFERLNHRMHNKMFIADGVTAITGGRNIGDEYFSRRDAGNFIDLDVLAAGPIVREIGSQFDQYWNSPLAISVTEIVRSDASRQQLQARFDAMTRAAESPALSDENEWDALAHRSPSVDMREGRLELAWGTGQSFADPPGKGLAGPVGSDYGVNRIRMNAVDRIRSADKEVLLTSPYFIPGPSGLSLLREASDRAVAVAVLTNSLASTDQPLVHSAYRRYRVPLLQAGVQLYELSPNYAGRDDRRRFFGLSAAGLHTKCLVIDRQEVFIGSMNFDPRSDHYNTENAVAILVPAVARDAAQLLNLAKREAANRVQIGADGHLEWVIPVGNEEYVHDQEPDAGGMLRLWLQLVSPLAPESLL